MNIFIDTEDMEERYGEELYKEYLENENKELQQRIDKAIEEVYKGIDSCNASLSNPEYTMVNKHILLKIEMDNLQKIKRILQGEDNESIN